MMLQAQLICTLYSYLKSGDYHQWRWRNEPGKISVAVDSSNSRAFPLPCWVTHNSSPCRLPTADRAVVGHSRPYRVHVPVFVRLYSMSKHFTVTASSPVCPVASVCTRPFVWPFFSTSFSIFLSPLALSSFLPVSPTLSPIVPPSLPIPPSSPPLPKPVPASIFLPSCEHSHCSLRGQLP